MTYRTGGIASSGFDPPPSWAGGAQHPRIQREQRERRWAPLRGAARGGDRAGRRRADPDSQLCRL